MCLARVVGLLARICVVGVGGATRRSNRRQILVLYYDTDNPGPYTPTDLLRGVNKKGTLWYGSDFI